MFINEIVSYVPETSIDIARDHDKLSLSSKEAKVYTKLYGFSSCPTFDGNIIDLLRGSLDKFFLDKDQEFIDNIKILVYIHTGATVSSINTIIPNEIKRIYKISNAICFGSSTNNCVGIFYAINLCNEYLKNFPNNSKALIITGEISNITDMKVIHNIAISGDASTALILSKEQLGFRIKFTETKCYSKYYAGIWVAPNSELQKDFENNYQERITDIIYSSLLKHKLTIEDIDYINPHNVNMWVWKNTAKRLNIDVSKIFLNNINKTAHCFSSDMLLNLDSMKKQKLLKENSTILMVTAGVGGFFGTSLLQVV